MDPDTRLFHFSEDPGITCFVPRLVRVPVQRPPGDAWLNGPLVWAIAEAHQRLYLFPRDCPRILLWPTERSIEEDRRTWLGDLGPGMQAVAYVQRDWLPRLASATIHRYLLPADGFRALEDVGMAVCAQTVIPMGMDSLHDLPAALHAAGTELRALDTLQPLRPVWDSSLHASGIRLRNARGWA